MQEEPAATSGPRNAAVTLPTSVPFTVQGIAGSMLTQPSQLLSLSASMFGRQALASNGTPAAALIGGSLEAEVESILNDGIDMKKAKAKITMIFHPVTN
jgi:hypothetical protein